MNDSLAIVIPAYKIDFFNETLLSISKQTNQNFTLYIGDDCSPSNLKEIVELYTDLINIKYKRFDVNMGGSDLVGHWERCIEMCKSEKWVWLFSDDDIMEANCVESFYEAVRENSSLDLFHFNIQVINDNGDDVETLSEFPKFITGRKFNYLRWNNKINSYVVEYIFRKEKYESSDRFVNFKHAWHSDESTWTRIGWEQGIQTIPGARVKWRRSAVNITSDNRSINVVLGKLQASIDFAGWINTFYKGKGIQLPIADRFVLAKKFVFFMSKCKKALSKSQEVAYLKGYLGALNIKWTYYFFLFYLKTK